MLKLTVWRINLCFMLPGKGSVSFLLMYALKHWRWVRYESDLSRASLSLRADSTVLCKFTAGLFKISLKYLWGFFMCRLLSDLGKCPRSGISLYYLCSYSLVQFLDKVVECGRWFTRSCREKLPYTCCTSDIFTHTVMSLLVALSAFFHICCFAYCGFGFDSFET